MSSKSESNFVPYGAVYLPAGVWNTYQMWSGYSPAITRRDFGFAKLLGLNAIRVLLSYEYWRERPAETGRRMDDLLAAAKGAGGEGGVGLRVMGCLFEGNGPEATGAMLHNTDPRTAVCVMSPSRAVLADASAWDAPMEFLRWFMERYRGDDRLAAIEVMNEPGQVEGLRVEASRFARALLKEADRLRGSVPLTVGSAGLGDNMHFLDAGLDILQFHNNFPRSLAEMERGMREAAELQAVVGKPVWLGEWQRTISSNAWMPGEPLAGGCDRPGYATLAGAVRGAGIGAFFWSLMFRPAYLNFMRDKGLWNGVFHEDGSVFSLEDARAISGREELQLPERKDLPAWGR